MVVVCEIAEGVNVKEPPALLTTMFGKDAEPAENVAALAVSNVHVEDDATMPPADLKKLPFTVMLGTLRAPLPLNVKLWYVVSFTFCVVEFEE
jgi:hypothetical protein